MIRTIIVDDEPNAVKLIENALTKHMDNIRVVAKAYSLHEAEAIINASDFDLLLLDIDLVDGTGFDLLEKIENKNFSLIFITAYNQHAIKAFKYSAVDYLLKPLNIRELIAAIDKISQRKKETGFEIDAIQSLLANLQSIHPNKLAVNAQSETVFVDVKDVVRLESYGNYTKVFFNDKSHIVSSKTLGEYENMLREDSFFRCHYSHLININYVKKYMRKDGLTLILKDGSVIPVSTRRKDDFERFVKRFTL
jgi:two-component system LytT family response regulator